jgi:hypothetical protein
MPLNTEITRDGKALEIHWGHFHVAAMVLAATMDSGEGPFAPEHCSRKGMYGTDGPDDLMNISPAQVFGLVDYGAIGATPLNTAAYTLREKYVFQDTSDGEIFTLLPGDVLSMYRSWK